MTTFNNTIVLNLRQVSDLLTAKAEHGGPRPRPTFIEGEKGIGKTAGCRQLLERLPNRFERLIFIDGAATNQGDTRLPVISEDGSTVRITPTDLVKSNTDAPVLIVIDEIAKMNRPALNEMHCILEPTPHVGQYELAEGSMVVATYNFAAESLGDVLLDHTLDRGDAVIQRKDTNDEFVEFYGIPKGLHGVVIAFCKDTPEAFQSAFTDSGAENNSMITNPKFRGKQGKVFTPRGAEAASNAIFAAEAAGLSDDVLRGWLQGIIGIEAAAKMDAQLAYNKELPQWHELIGDPKGCKVPETAGARSVLVYSSLARLCRRENSQHFGAVATAVGRMGDSWTDVLMKHTLLHKPTERGSSPLWDAAQATPHMREWTLENMDLL